MGPLGDVSERAGRASAAGRPAGRRQFPGWDTRFPPRKVPVLLDRWTGPGGTVQTSLERRRLSPRARRVPRTLRARGGAITNTAGTKKRSRPGFYRKTLRPDFVSGRVSFRAGKLVSLLRT